jgi:hypothetical protein
VKVYDFPSRVTPEGNFELPDALAEALANKESVRVIVIVDEPTFEDEEAVWSRLTSEQLLAQYDADEIYDQV